MWREPLRSHHGGEAHHDGTYQAIYEKPREQHGEARARGLADDREQKQHQHAHADGTHEEANVDA